MIPESQEVRPLGPRHYDRNVRKEFEKPVHDLLVVAGFAESFGHVDGLPQLDPKLLPELVDKITRFVPAP